MCVWERLTLSLLGVGRYWLWVVSRGIKTERVMGSWTFHCDWWIQVDETDQMCWVWTISGSWETLRILNRKVDECGRWWRRNGGWKRSRWDIDGNYIKMRGSGFCGVTAPADGGVIYIVTPSSWMLTGWRKVNPGQCILQLNQLNH